MILYFLQQKIHEKKKRTYFDGILAESLLPVVKDYAFKTDSMAEPARSFTSAPQERIRCVHVNTSASEADVLSFNIQINKQLKRLRSIEKK
jgi:hypothetical protein